MHLSIEGGYVLKTVYKYFHFILDQNDWITYIFSLSAPDHFAFRNHGCEHSFAPFPADVSRVLSTY